MPSYRTGSPSFPPVIKILLIINAIAFFAQQSFPAITEWGALHYWKSPLFKPHQIITHMFLHGNFPHILFNMLALWMFGSILENFWGATRFLNFYLICGVGAAIVQILMIPFEARQAIGPHPEVSLDVLQQAYDQYSDQY